MILIYCDLLGKIDFLIKGQIISKGLFGILGFFQKRMNKFGLVLLGKKTEFVRLFFGRIQGYQKTFRNYLTFSNGQIYGGDFAKFCGLLTIYELYLSTRSFVEISLVSDSIPY